MKIKFSCILKKIFIAVYYYIKAIKTLKNNPNLFRCVVSSWYISLKVFFYAFLVYLPTIFINKIWLEKVEVPKNFEQNAIKSVNQMVSDSKILQTILKIMEIKQSSLEENAMVICVCLLTGIIFLLIAFILHDFCTSNINRKIIFVVEKITTGKVLKGKDDKSSKSFWYFIKLIFMIIKKSIILLLTIILLIALCYIPMMGKIITLFFSGYFPGIFYLNIIFKKRKISQKRKKRRILKNIWLVVSFGWISIGIVLIPFINIILMPLNIIAGTMIAVEKVDRRKQSFTRSHPRTKKQSSKIR